MIGHGLCAEDPYSLKNPRGYLNFGTAENHLMDEILLPKLNQPLKLDSNHIQYNTLYGMEDVRITCADFLERYLRINHIKPTNLVMQTGVSAICESLSFAMFDQDDIIMIPSPYYTGFEYDFTKRFGCKFLKVQQSHLKRFSLSIVNFEKNYNEAPDKSKIKAILITQPNNPTGEILSKEFIVDIINFAKKYDLELISDEIYALSNHDSSPHHSLYQDAFAAGAKAHLLYGLAKDFALAGLKVGMFYTEDTELLKVMQELSYFHPISTHTQLLVKSLLSDDPFLKNFIKTNNTRLAALDKMFKKSVPNINLYPCKSGLFMMMDLSDNCESFEDETKLFKYFINNLKINMIPGKELGLTTPGFFRICYAKKKEDVLEFIVRMKRFRPREI